MSTTLAKHIFLADLHQRIAEHCETVVHTFCPLPDAQLAWQPTTKGKAEWSILQCFDHLNLTHAYYMAKLNPLLPTAPRAMAGSDQYKPSFWGGIYMHFALNPQYSFPSPEPVTPVQQPTRQVLAQYLAHQEALLHLCETVAPLDLRTTMVPIEKFVHFNLGDCLKILVYHDELHIGQAQRVYGQPDGISQQQAVAYR
jgi:hypothetical protein